MSHDADARQPACQACRYFVPNEFSVGTCYRFPPQYANNGNPNENHRWKHPSVSLHGWCGEFRPRRK